MGRGDLEMTAGGTPASTLWDELVRSGSQFAAAGFIKDMFGQLEMATGLQDDDSLAEGMDLVRSRTTEDIMHILDDNDGRKVREWMKLFKDDKPAFDEKAFDWAGECCDRAIQ